MAVVFDLEGFTDFTRQVDPQLTVPIFVSDFLKWLFDDIKRQLIQNEENATLWSELPFFSKFLGDGVLFLWRINLDEITSVDLSIPSEDIQFSLQEFICNIVASMLDVCHDYSTFLATVQTQHVDPPPRLRCGIARGTVIPIGKGADYVGPSINIAARLQKFNGLTFAFSARGINSEAFNEGYQKDFLKKRAVVRGIDR